MIKTRKKEINHTGNLIRDLMEACFRQIAARLFPQKPSSFPSL
ncbi:hypothetical protein BVRB_9g210250 [Beta vulgaris subsp. vulgaris]|nr:hypothetical protein BVRB_9g210250 [Beta vulgaris subsp. vulgaris]